VHIFGLKQLVTPLLQHFYSQLQRRPEAVSQRLSAMLLTCVIEAESVDAAENLLRWMQAPERASLMPLSVASYNAVLQAIIDADVAAASVKNNSSSSAESTQMADPLQRSRTFFDAMPITSDLSKAKMRTAADRVRRVQAT
jgi:hypothetical protein